VTAADPEGHLWRYDLRALWGDNRSARVFADSYDAHDDSPPTWSGITATQVPLDASVATEPWHAHVDGDPTSVRCAHTFVLRVWDRAINGNHRIHRSSSHESVTLLVEPAVTPGA
jgi:hypothetical protein